MQGREVLLEVEGELSASGDSAALIAAPGAGQRIAIVSEAVQLTASGTQTVIFKGATAEPEWYLAEQGASASMHHALAPGGSPRRLSTNTAYTLNLSDALATRYYVRYLLEDG